MTENYIFSGIGHALGKFVITNDELEIAVHKGFLKGFNEHRICESASFKEFLKDHPEVSPFHWFAEYKMGFRTRNHVVPFPPTKTKLQGAENSLHLAVKAVQNALDDAGVHPEEIDAWFLSTATPHEQAPGMCSTLKCFFVNHHNQTPTMTVTSACVGFNINIERSIEFFKCNPNAKHVVIVHAEVMSALLQRKTDFVPFTTFADASAAIVCSKVMAEKREGVLSIVNHEDLNMIDFLGANKHGDLYMDAGIVKNRAIENICKASFESLKIAGWELKDIELMVPHQTGNAIVHGAAEKMGFPLNKTFQEVQLNHGNLSGASIPLGLSILKKSKRLLPGMKILTATAGLGGEFGSYTYQVQQNIMDNSNFVDLSKDLAGKTALVTGSTGMLGVALAMELSALGCKLILQYNSADEKKQKLECELIKNHAQYLFVRADFTSSDGVLTFVDEVAKLEGAIDYIIHTAAITGSLSRAGEVSEREVHEVAQINQYAPVEITKKLKSKISSVILYVGSVAEDAQFSGSSAYVQAKRGLHGFAASFAYEAVGVGIRSIYYMPGIIDGGMTDKLDDKQKYNAMMSIGQEEVLLANDVAKRIVRSLYIPKVQKVVDKYEGALLVRRDGYKI